MAAKINKTVTISMKNGSQGKTLPVAGSVLGGGTRMAGSSAGFKTKNNGAKNNIENSASYGNARGIQANKGSKGDL